jgi:glutathione S-transferase
MRTLFHYPLCPYSRKIRLILGEKKLDFELENEPIWERRPEYIELNPAGKVPLLVDLNGTRVADSTAIAEYLEEAYPEKPLIGSDINQRAEVRRLVAWFDDKFAQEVSMPLLMEKNLKRNYRLRGGPDSAVIRSSKGRVIEHLEYISWLIDNRKWLGGNEFSLADVAAAAHISVVDYLGDVPWDDCEPAREWYARIKSRPSFRPLLNDRAMGMPPSAHYTNLDF